MHYFWSHSGYGAQSGLLDFAFTTDLLREAKISDLIDSVVREYVLGLEVTMDDIVAVEFLNEENSTAIPLMICLRIDMAYF